MKTTVKKLSVKDIFEDKDFELLSKLYSNESKVVKTEVNVNFEKYIQLEDIGALECFATYNEMGDMVGFLVLVKNQSLHLSSFSYIVESYFIMKQYRGYGTGKILLSVAEEYAKDNGAIAILITAPKDSRLSIVANSFGYCEQYRVYMKEFNV